MLDLLDGDASKLADLESRVAKHLGFTNVFTSVGQVYPRSVDYDTVTALVQLAAGPSSCATTIRLMAGHELVTEGFQEGQVGSSAMPHKMNTRSCERVNGFTVILRGYASMVGELAGNQWNEGDVFCSVVRRVALPDSFYAIDGLFETFLTVLEELAAIQLICSFDKTIHKGTCDIRKHWANHLIQNDILKLPVQIELNLTSVLTQGNKMPLPCKTLKRAINKLHIDRIGSMIGIASMKILLNPFEVDLYFGI
jgi:hypothetical protein